MQKRRYKKTEQEVSLLGFGTMRLPVEGDDAKNILAGEVQKMVDYAIANGVNYFDTAYFYHEGVSENFIGEALKKHPRESFYLADKLPAWMVKEDADVERIFYDQLKKCQVDHFDFYLAHALNEKGFKKFMRHQGYEVLRNLQKEGKIGQLGFSFHDTPAVLEEIVNTYDWDFAQIQLNYLDWEEQDAKRQYEILTQKGLPVIVMEPVRGGTLADVNPAAKKIFEAADPSVSVASWAIRYAASLPNVLTVLSGMTNLSQVEDNVKTIANFTPLSKEEYDVVARALAAQRQPGAIPCTACRYCMDCPEGIDIPGLFALYNQYHAEDEGKPFKEQYAALDEKARASSCITCGKCSTHCPQTIDIPKWMETIAAFAK